MQLPHGEKGKPRTWKKPKVRKESEPVVVTGLDDSQPLVFSTSDQKRYTRRRKNADIGLPKFRRAQNARSRQQRERSHGKELGSAREIRGVG